MQQAIREKNNKKRKVAPHTKVPPQIFAERVVLYLRGMRGQLTWPKPLGMPVIGLRTACAFLMSYPCLALIRADSPPFSQGTPANDTHTAHGLRRPTHRTSSMRQLDSATPRQHFRPTTGTQLTKSHTEHTGQHRHLVDRNPGDASCT